MRSYIGRVSDADLTVLAFASWGVLAALPHTLWLLKQDCVSSCIGAYPGGSDILLITNYSHYVAQTGDLFGQPDPILRYVGIALSMRIGDIIGPFDPITVTVGYSYIWQFFVVPAALYLAVRWVSGARAGAFALIALVGTTHAALAIPMVPAVPFGTGNYQYALGLPTAVLALGATAWDDTGWWSGGILGIGVNIQPTLTLLAALTVAAVYALRRRWISVGRAATTCAIMGVPTFLIYALNHTGGQTTSRAATVAGGVTALGLVIGALIITTAPTLYPDYSERVSASPFHIASIFCLLVVVAGYIGGGWYYPYVGGYMGLNVVAGAVAIGVTRAIWTVE